MIPPLVDLKNESDVEQKLLFPLLTTAWPEGFGCTSADILTKPNIRRMSIGKGSSKKTYFPDYLVVLAGLPVLVIEAKSPAEELSEALSEARLYGTELNAFFPHNLNPVERVLVCNGRELWTASSDTAEPDLILLNSELHISSGGFARLVELCRRETLQSRVDSVRRKFRREKYERPANLVGGQSFRDEELPQNTFGATIAGDYGHIFNPKTRDDRELIVRYAYIGSLRRQRYVEPIDRLIRNAVAPAAAKLDALENTSRPVELEAILRGRKKLEHQILLLVGSVGAGKSTFVDYLSLVALPEDLRKKTVWLRLNLNEAPLSVPQAYDWLARKIVEEFRLAFSEIDFDALESLEKIFRPEMAAFRKGPLSLLTPTSPDFQSRLADKLSSLQSDCLGMAKAMARYLCSGPDRLLIIALDNCDKRTRDEQLTMFQVAQWVQAEFRCLIVLPIRDVTFDLHRYDPPLDTALKQFVFRIEPPQFSDVLQARVRLALEQIAQQTTSSRRLSYNLPNGFRVSYPAEDQAQYLASILRSVYAHDRFVRQVLTGIAGRNVRRALEIFLDFCMSGHIGEDQIYRIRFTEGQHILPLSTVARVLLRMQRRFYDGNKSYLKNLVQCCPTDPLPDHFVRIALLQWFSERLSMKGPAGVQGFHRVGEMVSDLAVIGHDAARVREELLYLAHAGCVVAEHLRTDRIDDEDLVKISSSGAIHLQLMANPEYLAACAEDTYIADKDLCRRIGERLSKGPINHFSLLTTTRNSMEFVEYIKQQSAHALRAPDVFLSDSTRATGLKTLREAEAGAAAAEVSLSDRLFVGGIPSDITEPELRSIFESQGVCVKGIFLPRDVPSGEGRGFAFLQTAGKGAALSALELDGQLSIRGRRLRISEAHPSEEDYFRGTGGDKHTPPLSNRIYLANLPFSFGAFEVRALLAEHELTARDVFIMTDKDSGRSRGAGFVELGSLDDAARAIGSLNGLDVEGRRLLARPAHPRDDKK